MDHHQRSRRLESRLREVSGRTPAEHAREENAYTLGVQAYLWGFPLHTFLVTGQAAGKVGASGVNTLRRYSELKTASDRFVVAPNDVTIDAYASYDVWKEPAVIRVPALAEPRWYLVQIGDAFDEVVRNVGGIHGPQPGDYVITGPDFRGAVPGEMTRVATRTHIGVVAVRIFVSGEADLAAAVEAQKGFHLVPLSAYLRDGLRYEVPELGSWQAFPGSAPDDLRFFAGLGMAMQEALPLSADVDDAMVAALHQIGLSVAKGFEWRALDAPARRGLARAARAAEEIVDCRWQALGEMTNGWRYNMAGGRAGHDFALRAALAKYMIGGQLAEQVLYPNCGVDEKDEPLHGARKYVLRFAKDQFPPVSVFWNLALYASDMFFVENDVRRYSIGSTTAGLTKDPDTSLTIAIQKDRPADPSNWLPAPDGPFNLTMRFYGPRTPILDGSYRLPPVQRAE